jgi:hypothetical protein
VDRVLLAALLVYAAASFVHYAHNAEFLADYPSLPAWLSRGGVYAAWMAVTALGALGYLLVRRARELAALSLLAIYALSGFDSLAHYALAPASAHTVAMNATIALELATAALLLAVVAHRLKRYLLHYTASGT